jgi:hypothetical protein
MRRTSKLAKTEEEVNTLLESVVPASEVFEKTTYETCERVLNETLGDTDAPAASNETTRYAAATSDSTSDKGSSLEGVTDIESAFDDLLA